MDFMDIRDPRTAESVLDFLIIFGPGPAWSEISHFLSLSGSVRGSLMDMFMVPTSRYLKIFSVTKHSMRRLNSVTF